MTLNFWKLVDPVQINVAMVVSDILLCKLVAVWKKVRYSKDFLLYQISHCHAFLIFPLETMTSRYFLENYFLYSWHLSGELLHLPKNARYRKYAVV